MSIFIEKEITPVKQKDIAELKEYSQFKTLKEFNNNFEMWMVDIKDKFTKSEYIALNRLRKFCVIKNIFGVTNSRVKKFLKGIKEKDFTFGVSRSTFRRMLVKAKTLGILDVIPTLRENGSQSSNIYVFKKYATATSEAESIVSTDKTIEHPRTNSEQPQTATVKEKDVLQLNTLKTNISYTKTIEILNKRIDVLDSSFTSEYVPKPFKELVRCFTSEFDNAHTIEEFWKLVKIQTYHLKHLEDEKILNVAMVSFKQMINKYKKGGVKNPFGYYWGILNKKLDELYFEEMRELRLMYE